MQSTEHFLLVPLYQHACCVPFSFMSSVEDAKMSELRSLASEYSGFGRFTPLANSASAVL